MSLLIYELRRRFIQFVTEYHFEFLVQSFQASKSREVESLSLSLFLSVFIKVCLINIARHYVNVSACTITRACIFFQDMLLLMNSELGTSSQRKQIP